MARRLLLIIRLVKSTLAGAQRLLVHQTTKKEPFTVSQLEQLVASKADSIASLYNIRSVVICLLAFAAFLRFDEFAKLVRSDVKIENDMLKLFIQSSKTDQYRHGGFSPSCCSTTPFQLACDLVLWNCMLLGLYITFL